MTQLETHVNASSFSVEMHPAGNRPYLKDNGLCDITGRPCVDPRDHTRYCAHCSKYGVIHTASKIANGR